MNKIAKISLCAAFVVAFCCIAIGYAAVQDALDVNGTVSFIVFDPNATYCIATTENITGENGEEGVRLRIYQRKFEELPAEGRIFDDERGRNLLEGETGGYTVSGVYSWPSGVDTATCRTISVFDSWRSDSSVYSTITDVVAVATGTESGYITPTTLTSWFEGFSACQRFDLTALDTQNATSMKRMFYGCHALRHDSSTNYLLMTVDTTKATSLERMFTGCSNLRSIEGVEFVKLQASSLKSVDSMFRGCFALKEINLSNLTFQSGVGIILQFMFSECYALTDLTFPSTPITSIDSTGIQSMFFRCEALVTLDLTFLQGNIQNGSSTLQKCYALRTIYVSSKIKTDGVVSNMFLECNSLVGGNGTAFNSQTTVTKAAHVDGENGHKGYFTCIVQPKLDATLSETLKWSFSTVSGKTAFEPGADGYLKLSGTDLPAQVELVSSDASVLPAVVDVDSDGIIIIPARFMVARAAVTIGAVE